MMVLALAGVLAGVGVGAGRLDLGEGVELIPRSEWGAKAPVLDLGRHEIDRITVHHTGVRQNPGRDFFDKLRGLQAWSQREDQLAGGRTKPQWADIPYHYYIDWEGRVAECRPVEIPGDTNTSYDVRGHALVVIEGSFPDDYFNFRQRRALRRVVFWLAREHGVGPGMVKGHVDYTPGETTCPGSSVMDYLPHVRRWLGEERASWRGLGG